MHVRSVFLGVVGVVNADDEIWCSGDAGRRRLRGKVECVYGVGEAGTESYSVVARGVKSSSEFSEIVWSMSS